MTNQIIKVSGLMLLCYIFGTNAISQELSNYSVSWLGNSFKGEPGWVPQDVEDIFVSPDGTVYTNVRWEEDRNNVVQIKNGDFIDGICPFAGDGGSNVPRNVGRTITANNNYVYYASPSGEYGSTGHGITRRNRADIDAGHKNVEIPAEVNGLAATENYVFAACDDGKIRKYTIDLGYVSQWDVTIPNEMCLDKEGNIWVLSGNKNALRYDQNGTRLPQEISFPDGVYAADIALMHDGRLIVADNGKNNNLRIYDNISGSPQLDEYVGETGGVYAGKNKGELLPGKLIHPIGVGCDAEGNIYWASGMPGQQGKSIGSTIIQSQKPDLSINWRVFCLTWIDVAALDPADETSVYTKNAHFLMDWSKSNGEEQKLKAITFNKNQYPEDPRIDYPGNGHRGGPIVRILDGHRIQFNNNMYGEMFITRFDGEIGIPCGYINDGGLWYDINGDGYRQGNESVQLKLGDCMGYYVDDKGDVWVVNQQGIIHKFPFEGINPQGVPIYSADSKQQFSKPAGSSISTFRRILYIPEEDVLLLGGGNNQHPVQHWKPMGPVLEKFTHWSDAPSKQWTKILPYERHDGQHETYEPFGMSAAGNYIFIVFQGSIPKYNLPRGTVGVYEKQTGDFVGYMFTPTSFATAHLGIMDVIWAINVYQRDNGEYVVFIEEDGRSKVTMFRWCPSGECKNTGYILLDKPEKKSRFLPGEEITIIPQVSTNNAINKVEYFADNTKIGESVSDGFQFSWSNPHGNGHYSLSARMITEEGDTVSTSNPLNIFIYSPKVDSLKFKKDSFIVRLTDSVKITYELFDQFGFPVDSIPTIEIMGQGTMNPNSWYHSENQPDEIKIISLFNDLSDTAFIRVYQPEVSKIKIKPFSPITYPGKEMQFQATTYDQYQIPMETSPTWQLVGSCGELNQESAVFTAHESPGSCNIVATSATITDTVTINVQDWPEWVSEDIGIVAFNGNSTYLNDSLSIKASGADIGGTSDAFHFAYRFLPGDGFIEAKIDSLTVTHASAKVGVMIRRSNNPSSAYAMMMGTGNQGNKFQYRSSGRSESQNYNRQDISVPAWIKLLRENDTISAYESEDGTTWNEVGNVVIELGDTALVGIAATSHTNEKLLSARLSNILVTGVDPVKVTSISLDQSELQLNKYESAQLHATVMPANATVPKVNWVSENPDIAWVLQDGTISTYGVGNTVIKAATVDGGLTATCQLSIVDTTTSIQPPDNQRIWKIYPNPANSGFTIDGSQFYLTGVTHITIQTLNGQVLYRERYNQKQIMNIQPVLSSGVYIVSIKNGSMVWRQKLVIQ